MIRWGYLKRVLAGAIFGLYMAHLLYFLNPQVDITIARLATVTLVYGITCGLLFGSILWGLRGLRVWLFGKPETYRTHGFGFVVCAAFVSSFIYWMHLRLLEGYLPVGALRILSKATNVLTVTAFILLALWVLERNADRRRSRAIFTAGVLLIAVSSVFLYQRRESYRTERKEVVVANIGAVGERQQVILIAIRNLPYDWIVTMKGEGLLPFFETATERAYFARVEPFPTTSPKSLWASLATGKLPYRHRVTGRFSYRTPLNRAEPFLLLPYGVGFRAWGLIPPVERISAPLPSGEALPLWTLFRRLLLSAEVFRWPSVGTRVAHATFVPPVVAARFNAAGPAKATVVAALSSDLAALEALEADARGALSAAGIEGFSVAQRAVRVYLNELPPRGTVKGDVVRAYAQRLDQALSRIEREHPDHLLIVCSPSAVVPKALPANIGVLVTNSLRRDEPGADDGFVLVTGENTAHREHPAAASVVDIVPTVLFGAGLPIARDMDGRILYDAFADELLRSSTVTAIQTYEAERVEVRRTERRRPGG
ncbi:MAG TPA: hypothetical protein VEK11_18820 [Thermoanaerobaculia bacterium]|nr:hypothetical protein [Thermoanaerobaculia bacterium]